jgi:hypothetical protein
MFERAPRHRQDWPAHVLVFVVRDGLVAQES